MVALPWSDDDGKPTTKDEAIIREAYDRYNAVKDWQGTQDEYAREDIKFANGDARNRWQWPDKTYDIRDGNDLPALTINNTRVHNDMIINAMAKNSFAPKVRPVGGKASYQSAQLMQKLVRRTLDISKYSTHRRRVSEQQIDGGIGYFILETRYISERSFDQDIYITSSRDPTGVYLDPWITEPDGSDANFGHVFSRFPRKEFNRKYPAFKGKVGSTTFSSGMGEWISDKEIVVCKYYRKSESDDTLISYKDDQEGDVVKLASEIKDEAGKEIFKRLISDIKNGVIDGQTRKIGNPKVEWFLIAGDVIVDEGDWAGKYIPIFRVPGREIVIDAKPDRKGHTRPLIDAQRMLNYAASISIQNAASGVKAQWLGSARAFEGQEGWKSSNTDNFAALLYNDIDDEAPVDLQRIDPPQRIEPVQVSAAWAKALQDSERQMMMISGQYEAQMGENDTQSAASGKAIGERKAQGDTATYHFSERMSDAERFIAVQLLDLYPKIYDTERVLQVTGEDGEKAWIKINPAQDDAVQELEEAKDEEEAIRLAFNPSIGEFECISDPGPDFATQRQEAWQAYSLILQQNMQLASVIGDLIFKFGDFPGADEIASRLEKEIKATKPYLFDDKAEPQLVALNQQMQRLTALNAELMQKLALKELALKGKDERRDVEASNAETKRLQVIVDFLSKTMLSPADQARMEHEIMSRTHDAALTMISDANAAELAQQAKPDDAGAAQ